MHLCARSPVFRAILDSNMSEADPKRVLITDFDAHIVNHFVQYVHLGRIDAKLDVNDSTELLRMAEKYAVQGLKELAIDCIVPQFSLANIAAVFNNAVLMQDVDRLKEACGDFITKNRTEINKQNVYQNFSHKASQFLLSEML